MLDAFEEEYEGTLDVVIVNDRADAIGRAIGDVKQALFIGLILTVLVIYFFMKRWILRIIICFRLFFSI